MPTIFLSGEFSNAGMPWLPEVPLLFNATPVDPEILVGVVESFATLGRLMRSRGRRHAG